jgi:predicted ATP-dependent protease
MSVHVQQEMALVWSGGGRRYFTRRAALRGAAKAIIRDFYRAYGDDPSETDPVEYQAYVAQLVSKIERGERPELDPEAARAALREAAKLAEEKL